MSGTNAGHQPHTSPDVTPDQKPSDDDCGPDVPTGYEVDHHDPDEFSVRCTNCGHLETYSSRARAHRKADHHGLECSPTGVTPLTELDAATDGGQFTSETERIYVVSCDECGLYESYKNERLARGHKLTHWDDRQHVANVKEAEAYADVGADFEGDRRE